ncbi:MAG: hypothetical protein ACTHK2_09080 [Dokdonella sp.]|uniref:hypothetical protein n=1 Tax=Dokdonella sp. TaxID=2291710 RepID=UPI003F7EDDE6
MSRTQQSAPLTALEAVIQRQAQECESCLRLADFAAHEPAYGPRGAGMADGMRKLAQMHADEAWRAITLTRSPRAAQQAAA